MILIACSSIILTVWQIIDDIGSRIFALPSQRTEIWLLDVSTHYFLRGFL